jgi:hypothetical protein
VLDSATNEFFRRQHIAFLPSALQSPDTTTANATAGGSVPTWQGTHQAVNSSLWTHPSEHYLQWRGSDPSFSKFVPQAGKPVCVAAVGVPPPPAATSAAPFGRQQGVQSVPGLYLFTCRRPTAYICQCECSVQQHVMVSLSVWSVFQCDHTHECMHGSRR